VANHEQPENRGQNRDSLEQENVAKGTSNVRGETVGNVAGKLQHLLRVAALDDTERAEELARPVGEGFTVLDVAHVSRSWQSSRTPDGCISAATTRKRQFF
jgi:hypothetical protein